jgi:hypothetical protein
MDGDHAKKTKKQVNSLKRRIVDASDVLPTVWVRLPFQVDNGGNWLILGSRSYLLWNLRIILCLLYFAVQIFKQS